MSDEVRPQENDQTPETNETPDSEADFDAGQLWDDMKEFFSGSDDENNNGPGAGDSNADGNGQKESADGSDYVETIAKAAVTAAEIALDPKLAIPKIGMAALQHLPNLDLFKPGDKPQDGDKPADKPEVQEFGSPQGDGYNKITKYPENDPSGRVERKDYPEGERDDDLVARTQYKDGVENEYKNGDTTRTREYTDKDGNVKETETEYKDGKLESVDAKGNATTSHFESINRLDGKEGRLAVDDKTGKATALDITDKDGNKQSYRFKYDEKGDLSEMRLPDGSTLTKVDGKWQHMKDGKPSKDGVPGFNVEFDENGNIKGDFKVSKSGDIQYKNGEITESRLADGRKETIDFSEYSRTTELNGKTQTDYWDGHEWRQGKATKNADGSTTVTFPKEDGKPVSMTRKPDTNELTVDYGNGRKVHAYWNENKQVETVNGKETTRYYDGSTYREAEKVETDPKTGEKVIKFKRDGSGKDPYETRYNPKTGEMLTKYDHVHVHKNKDGLVDRVDTRKGSWKFKRDGDGDITQVTMPDGTVLKRQGEEKTQSGLARQDSWYGEGENPNEPFDNGRVADPKNPPEFDSWVGKDKDGNPVKIDANFRVMGDGSIVVNKANGEKVTHHNEGITETRNKEGTITDLKDAFGSHWTSADGKTFKVEGSDRKFEGKPIYGRDGAVRIQTKDRIVQQNHDDSLSMFDNKGIERSRQYDNGVAIQRNEKGQITETVDAKGDTTRFNYKDGKLASVTDKDGKVVYKADEAGKLHPVNDKGEINKEVEVTVAKNGAIKEANKDGSSVTRFADGTVAEVQKDGSSVIRHTDGSITETEKDGSSVTSKPDGSTITRLADGTITEKAKDGSSLTRHSDGTITTADKQGRVTSYESAAGKWEYEYADDKSKQPSAISMERANGKTAHWERVGVDAKTGRALWRDTGSEATDVFDAKVDPKTGKLTLVRGQVKKEKAA